MQWCVAPLEQGMAAGPGHLGAVDMESDPSFGWFVWRALSWEIVVRLEEKWAQGR